MKKAALALCLVLLLSALGTAMAGSISHIANLTVTPSSASSLFLQWSEYNDGDFLYTVTCQAEGTDRVTERRTYKTYGTLNYLVPGQSYIITVYAEGGNTLTATAATVSASPYADFNFTLRNTGVYQSPVDAETYTPVTTLSAATLSENLDANDYSMLLNFTMAATTENKYLDLQLVLYLPNGDAFTVDDVLWYDMNQTSASEYRVFTSALKKAYDAYGGFDAGEYTLSAYIDGMLAATATFTVE